MRISNIVSEVVLFGLSGFLICITIARKIFFHFYSVVVEYFLNSDEVTWVTYIHGIGDGLYGWHGNIITRFQITRKRVIYISNCNKVIYGQSHLQ